jgi:membrane protease YdiL (CAAX protease family)
MLAVCAVLKFADLPANYRVLTIAEIIMCATIFVFAIKDRKALIPVIINKNIKWWLFPVIAVGAIVAHLGISYLVDMLNRMNDDIFYTYMYEDTSNPLLWSVISIALQPAIFEELAFRGVMYNHLEKVMDIKAVLIVTGMLFAILHISPVSIIWLLPFGIFAAWMRQKSGHLWYGVAFHFFFNLTYVMTEAWHRGWL